MTLYTSTIAPYGAPKQAETRPFRGALACERTGARAEVLRHTREKISRDGHAKGGELAPRVAIGPNRGGRRAIHNEVPLRNMMGDRVPTQHKSQHGSLPP